MLEIAGVARREMRSKQHTIPADWSAPFGLGPCCSFARTAAVVVVAVLEAVAVVLSVPRSNLHHPPRTRTIRRGEDG